MREPEEEATYNPLATPGYFNVPIGSSITICNTMYLCCNNTFQDFTKKKKDTCHKKNYVQRFTSSSFIIPQTSALYIFDILTTLLTSLLTFLIILARLMKLLFINFPKHKMFIC